ncbi:MAG: ferrous iron transport protein A [Actinomycetia bacterium]|nr:ferrous iron transport protein A [Actinomycetes bacterium]
MSKLSALLSQREVAPCPPIAAGPVISLAELKRGQRAVICDVSGDIDLATARRLVDLGFTPGTEVQALRKAPLADPLMFRIAGYEIALRRAQARCIHGVTTA